MKVQELLKEEKLSDYALRLVQRLGIRKLGSGAYAHVFQHPTYSNVVVKVYTAKDKVYKRYIEWCQKHQGNPYAPRVASLETYTSPSGDKYNFVFMEKMKPVSQARFLAWLSDVFGPKAAEAAKEHDYDTLRKLMDKGIAKKPDEALKEIWAHIMTYPASQFDIHAGNVMTRDNHLVFTDPVGADVVGDRVDGYKGQ